MPVIHRLSVCAYYLYFLVHPSISVEFVTKIHNTNLLGYVIKSGHLHKSYIHRSYLVIYWCKGEDRYTLPVSNVVVCVAALEMDVGLIH